MSRRLPGLAALAGALALVSGCLAHHPGPAPDAPPDAVFVTVDGVPLHVLDVGPREAPAVLMLHGFASSLDTWRPLAPFVAARHRVIAVDLMGFGLSGRPDGDYSPPGQARLLLGLLDQLGVDRVRVVAHSWGSSVALALTLAAPERVDRLALYAAWVYDEQLPPFFRWARAGGLGEVLFAAYYRERPDERMARAFYDPGLITEAYVEQVVASLDRPGTVAAALAAARGQDFSALAPRYRTVVQPTLLLWGREDAVAPVAFGERLARDLPRARLVVYPRCGHFPMVEAAAASARELLAFLAADAP